MMRDKLFKTGHKAWYYRFRKLGVFTAFIIAGGLVAIVPARQISIEIKNLHAQQANEENSQEAAVNSDSSDTLLDEELLSL